jgi:hypothetical protein
MAVSTLTYSSETWTLTEEKPEEKDRNSRNEIY